ncbi:ABC transporter ATP-binding protein/permease [Amylibacter sp.]|nr:ABC transporter ATP-binding protein/permease [Amylibacter sp.]
MKDYFKKIIYLIGPDIKKLPWMLFLFVILSLFEIISLGLIIPYISIIVNPDVFFDSYVYQIISKYYNIQSSHNLLIILGIFLIFIFTGKSLLSITINKIILKFSNDKGASIREQLLNSYQNMSYEEYSNKNSSECIHAIQVLATQFSQNTMIAALKFISEGILVLAILGFLAVTNIIALITIVGLITVFIYLFDLLYGNKVDNYGTKINQFQTQTILCINESIEGFKEIKVLGKEKYFKDKLSKLASNYSDAYTNYLVLTTVPRYLLELILIFLIVIMVFITIFSGGELLNMVPTLTVFGVASLRLMPAANAFSTGLSQLRFGYNSTNIIFNDLSKISSKFEEELDVYDVNKDFNKIELQNISFSYGNKPIFKNVSLTIEKGSSIGIIGATGTGKTTLINLILGLILPTSGNVIINNQKLVKNTYSQLKGLTAYIPQNIFLVDDTIKKNIALGLLEEEIDHGKVLSAVKQARLAEFVKSLAEGLETHVGQSGNKLSGGQRQRVSLARAFYFDKQVLVMDEATSALDRSTEQEISKEIKNIKGDITTITVAHRLSTLKNCDKIYEIKDGDVVLRGTYDDII